MWSKWSPTSLSAIVPKPISFKDLWIVDGHIYDTFKELIWTNINEHNGITFFFDGLA